MVLDKVPVRGRPTNLDNSRAGACCGSSMLHVMSVCICIQQYGQLNKNCTLYFLFCSVL